MDKADLWDESETRSGLWDEDESENDLVSLFTPAVPSEAYTAADVKYYLETEAWEEAADDDDDGVHGNGRSHGAGITASHYRACCRYVRVTGSNMGGGEKLKPWICVD